jgi:hypothetical protein
MTEENQVKLTYSFSAKEIGLLAKFLREKETEIPHADLFFHGCLRNCILLLAAYRLVNGI